MGTILRWTSADLAALPDDHKRYEIIDGELCVSRQPGYHQYACSQLNIALGVWSNQTNTGVTLQAPGVIFTEDNDVAPDVVWISHARLATALDQAGHFRAAPELVIEVLSPGSAHEHRDRDMKQKLYARQGVLEYWIVDWQQRQVTVYRRQEQELPQVALLSIHDMLTSPLLPGFACPVAQLFAGMRPLHSMP